ncbi:MAG: ATP-binding protein [Clostridia bacterium]|nr:ATP-binding protein [Clostridia bacterium]
MGYNKENFKRIRAEYETKTFLAQSEADARREELYREIPDLQELDRRLSEFGLRIMQTALNNGDTADGIAALRAENERICKLRASLLRSNGYPEDYSDPKYECIQCRDTGYVGIKMCGCMRRRLIEAGMDSSGLSALMRKQSFENFSTDYYRANPEEYQIMSENYRNIHRYAQNFSIEPNRPMPSSLLFLGGTGLGKTHLSTAVARVVIERGYDVYYNSAVGMLSDFERQRFGNGLAASGADDTARYTECDLLIIDDLGTEVVNQFTLSCLYHVINTRLNLQRPMIISTNLKSAELRKNYTDRIASRLTGEFQVIPFYGTDIRKQKLQNG